MILTIQPGPEPPMMLTEMFDGYTWQMFLLVAMVFVLAGLVKGVVGLGLPTISMALLSIFMIPAQAAALLVIPSLEIGRAHVCTPVTNAPLVCSLLLEKKKLIS